MVISCVTNATVKTAEKSDFENWPVLKRYDLEHIARIALPFGGIGTGTVSLGGRGDLRDWEIMNRPAKGFVPISSKNSSTGPFFALYTKTAKLLLWHSKAPLMSLLMRPVTAAGW